jgi:hypothetical protein
MLIYQIIWVILIIIEVSDATLEDLKKKKIKKKKIWKKARMVEAQSL